MQRWQVLSGWLLLVLLAGCGARYPSYRLGQFTVASSNNVRNLSYSIDDKTKATTTGEDCYLIESGNPNDARLQRAMDAAIKAGQDAGVDGDMLVNVRIDQKVVDRPGKLLGIFPDTYDCLIVTGDLVKISE